MRQEPERISLKEQTGLLYCPFATQYKKQMPTRGKFRHKYPEGLVVHYTAGDDRGESSAPSTIEYGITQGYAYWSISPAGTIYQTHKLDSYGWHAGKSIWPGLGTSLSQYLLGVEICCGGTVDKNNKTWFGRKYPDYQIRTIPTKRDNITAGRYVKYTEAQEEALINLCLWLKNNNPDVFNLDLVLGHDEIAPGRKADPGGSLSMTMPEFRTLLLKKLVDVE